MTTVAFIFAVTDSVEDIVAVPRSVGPARHDQCCRRFYGDAPDARDVSKEEKVTLDGAASAVANRSG